MPSMLKVSIAHRGTMAYISLGVSVLPEQWNKHLGQIQAHPQAKLYNGYIQKRLADMQAYILRLTMDRISLGHKASDIKALLERELSLNDGSDKAQEEEQEVGYGEYFDQVAKRKQGKTQDSYMHTLGRLRAFDPAIDNRPIERISKSYLEEFGMWLKSHGNSPNTIALHYRNMRTIFNDAIDNDVSTYYPFRRFKIKTVQTAKRSLSVEELRTFFSSAVDDTERRYLDTFKLIFFLVGINMVDLCQLREITSEGRIEYTRSKTKRLYSIKVEPEALEIIERYRGEKYLLDIYDTYSSHVFYRQKTNKHLQRIGHTIIGKRGKKSYTPLHPSITTYWARHSWATIAASLDVPKETIAAALGHGGNSVTDIYIDFDRSKIDDANRRVIDYVLRKGEYAK